MVSSILVNTPPWVWGLLAALLALGISQLFPRRAGLTRILILPFAMTGLALFGIVSAFGTAAAVLLAWCATLAVAAWGMTRRPLPANTFYDSAARRFALPGSALPLLLILGLFSTKYAVGVLLALRPGLAADAAFATAVAALYGMFSGVFAGRALRLLRLAGRRAR